MYVGVKILVRVRGQHRVDLPGPIAGRLFNNSMDGATVNNFQSDQLHQIEVWARRLALVLKGELWARRLALVLKGELWARRLALVLKGELWARRLALVLKGSMHRLLQRALQGLVSPNCAQCSTPVWIS